MKRSSLNFDHLTALNMIQYQVITIPSFPQSLFISSILKSNTMGATSRAETAYPYKAP